MWRKNKGRDFRLKYIKFVNNLADCRLNFFCLIFATKISRWTCLLNLVYFYFFDYAYIISCLNETYSRLTSYLQSALIVWLVTGKKVRDFFRAKLNSKWSSTKWCFHIIIISNFVIYKLCRQLFWTNFAALNLTIISFELGRFELCYLLANVPDSWAKKYVGHSSMTSHIILHIFDLQFLFYPSTQYL